MPLVIDTSALVSVMLGEDSAERIVDVLEGGGPAELSAANYVELVTVMAMKDRSGASTVRARIDRLLATLHIVLAAVDQQQAVVAASARIRFGHPAQLNYGDSFAYALAKVRAAPLLFVGEDFAHTDIVSALVASDAP